MKIYRLENWKGYGPFHASQGMCECLVPHYDPESPKMLESIGISKSEFSFVTDQGMLFGWNTYELMKKFFKHPHKAIKRASEMKMKISVYEANTYFLFFDGQVLFLKESDPVEKLTLKEFFDKG